MIYFSLWAGAVLALIISVSFFTGSVYGEIGKRFYQVFPIMQWIDLAYALILIAFAAYSIYTRFQLAGFKKGAPRKLLSLYIASFIINLAYVLCAASILTHYLVDLGYPDSAEQVWRFVGSSIWDLIPTLIMFLINKKYYGNRKELFVN